MSSKIFKFLFFMGFLVSLNSQIIVNEVCFSNGGCYYDFENKTPDWIELKNIYEDEIHLKDWRIGINDNSNTAYILPDTTIQSGEFLLIHCSKKESQGGFINVIAEDNEIASYRHYDSFDYFYQEFDNDFTFLINLKALKHYDNFGVAGVMFRESLDPKSKFLGLFGQNKQLFKFAFMHRDAINQNPSRWFSIYGLNYPDSYLKLSRKSDILTVAISDGSGYEIEKYSIEYPINKKIYAGFAIAGMEGNIKTQAVLGNLKINNEDFAFENLKFEPVNRKDKKPNFNKLNEIHTNFKLNNKVEKINIWNSELKLVESVNTKYIDRSNFSIGNFHSDIEFYDKPTPESNNINGKPKVMDTPISFLKSGNYESAQNLTLTHKDINSTVYYTLDGSDVDELHSKKYVGEPIIIDKSTVFKAKAYGIDAYPSEEIQQTFLINENSTIPIMSLIIDSLKLYGDLGIFVEKNYYEKIEHSAYFEFIEKDEVKYSTLMGVQLTGETSMYLDQKPMRFYARDKYGNDEINYNFFKQKKSIAYDKLWLRTASNDWAYSLLRDPFTNVLAELYTVLEPAKYLPINMFINGKYWGIYHLREFIDEDFLSIKHDINQNNINLLERDDIIKHGTPRTFEEFFDFVRKTDFSDEESYEIINNLVDIDNLIDYVAIQNYSCNVDWGSVNVKFWQSSELDNKWRWIMHDLDQTFPVDVGPSANIIEKLFDENSRFGLIFKKFSENEKFRNHFLNRTADLLNTGLKNTNTIRIFDSLANQILSEVPKHKNQWANSAVDFENQWIRIKEFLHHRSDFVFAQLSDLYKLEGTYEVFINNIDTTYGYVQINSITIKDNNWSGVYFKNIPISIKAIAKPGFTFVGWEGNYLENNNEISVISKKDLDVVPIFIESENTNYRTIVINEIMYKPIDSKDSKDWFEIMNNGAKDIDLSNWYFMDDNIKNKFLIPQKTILKAGEYLVFAENLAKFKEIYPKVDNVIGGFGFGLSSSGDKIELFDSSGVQIDIVEFKSISPWDPNANGTGFSLELIHNSLDNNVGSNWRASIENSGTPGRKNSITNSVSRNFIQYATTSIYPNPSSGNVNLSIYSEEEININLSIIDLNGNEVLNLIENYSLNIGANLIHKYADVAPGTYHIVIYDTKSNTIFKSYPIIFYR